MNIRKLGLFAAVCGVALVVGPIASASAAVFPKGVFTGTCFVEGQATFSNGLKATAKSLTIEPGTANQAKTTYSFKDKNVESLSRVLKETKEQVECKGTAKEGGNTGVGPWTGISAEVNSGEGNLECGTGSKDEAADNNWEGAKAIIKLEAGNGDKWTFTSYFRFKATARPGEITAELDSKFKGGGNKASGAANFVGPKQPGGVAAVEQCLTVGATKLSFETAEESVKLEGILENICKLLPPGILREKCEELVGELPLKPKIGITGKIGE